MLTNPKVITRLSAERRGVAFQNCPTYGTAVVRPPPPPHFIGVTLVYSAEFSNNNVAPPSHGPVFWSKFRDH